MPPRVAIVGAGAAGIMAAIFAARAGARVTLLESTKEGGRKIVISGGGRCNILPLRLDESRFVTDSSRNTLRKILRSWALDEQIEFFTYELGIPLALEAESAKYFPESNSAAAVRDTLIRHARGLGVVERFGASMRDLAPVTCGGWRIGLANGEAVDCDRVIVATGGLSVPKTGSDGAGLAIAGKLGHRVNPTYPALTPLLMHPAPFAGLAGVSLEVAIKAGSSHRTAESRGGFLFTHRGYSGPAVLDVSHVVARAASDRDEALKLEVNWSLRSPEEWTADLTAPGSSTVERVLRRSIPARLAAELIDRIGIDGGLATARLKRDDRQRLIQLVTAFPLDSTGTEGFKKAEVTGGGIDLAEIDPVTMESRRHPGLYFCGEILDAFGPIGGFNFAWAWITGRAAGRGTDRAVKGLFSDRVLERA